MKKLLITICLLCAPMLVMAAGAALHLDQAPDRSRDNAALQRGAKYFINYCLNCHSASYMRYNRLADIGLSQKQIEDNLMFTADKVGELMTIAMRRDDAKQWFGVPPPDLTVTARARASADGSGADWLYTYLRTFYRDATRPTGWNNVVFANVAMPHALWELQGEQVLGPDNKLQMVKPGSMSPAEYDNMVADLVAYMNYMAEPVASYRKELGVAVLLFLAVMFVLSYALKREYWKDIH